MTTATSPRKRGRPTTFHEEAFLRQTCDLFWEHGYDAIAFDRLVNETKVTRRALYNRFESKDALLKAVLDRYMGDLFAELTAVATEGRTPRQVLEQFCVKLMEIATDHGGRGCLLLNTVVLGNPPEWARPLFRDSMSNTEALLRQKMVDAGAAPDLATKVARLTCVALNGLTLRAKSGENLATLTADIQGFCDFFYPES